jgi:hypothetical protein
MVHGCFENSWVAPQKVKHSQVWWFMPVIPALRRQKDHRFKASLGYVLTPFSKNKQQKNS